MSATSSQFCCLIGRYLAIHANYLRDAATDRDDFIYYCWGQKVSESHPQFNFLHIEAEPWAEYSSEEMPIDAH